jgi:hypothetical protein
VKEGVAFKGVFFGAFGAFGGMWVVKLFLMFVAARKCW